MWKGKKCQFLAFATQRKHFPELLIAFAHERRLENFITALSLPYESIRKCFPHLSSIGESYKKSK